MPLTVVALYEDFNDARSAIEKLQQSGFTNEDISILAHERHQDQIEALDDSDHNLESIVGGSVTGATLGGIAGLVVAVSALTIPGIGPLVAAGAAAGPVAGVGLGAGAGAVAGGVIGAFVDMGVTEQDAEFYAEGIRRGGVVIGVQATGERADEARAILARHNPVDLDERSAQWREEGWQGYDENAEPLVIEGSERTSR